MSNENEFYKWGPIDTNYRNAYGDLIIKYAIVPRGYFAQEVSNPKNVYMFESYNSMDNYFKKQQEATEYGLKRT